MQTLVDIKKKPIVISTEPPDTIRVPEIEPGVGCGFDSYLASSARHLLSRYTARR